MIIWFYRVNGSELSFFSLNLEKLLNILVPFQSSFSYCTTMDLRIIFFLIGSWSCTQESRNKLGGRLISVDSTCFSWRGSTYPFCYSWGKELILYVNVPILYEQITIALTTTYYVPKMPLPNLVLSEFDFWQILPSQILVLVSY